MDKFYIVPAVRKGREMNIGDVIKCRRQKKNMTQAELAEKLNITPQAVSRWEMGVSYPDIAMIPLLSKELGVSADELLGIVPSYQKTVEPEVEASGKELAPDLNQSQADSIFDYVQENVSGENKKILVVDDADFLRTIVEDILTHCGHTVLQAKDGQEGLSMLSEEDVDVCLLDIHMPGMDGFEVLKKIKQNNPELKVVMISALAQENNVRMALQLGADSFVVKPFSAECLVERIG